MNKPTLAALACILSACGATEPKDSTVTQQAAKAVADAALAEGQRRVQPLGVATQKALDQMHEDYQKKAAERRAVTVADREARAPKAYRWKDKDGTWHISDTPPAPEIAVEVIPLQRL